jgi:hypothetical protein
MAKIWAQQGLAHAITEIDWPGVEQDHAMPFSPNARSGSVMENRQLAISEKKFRRTNVKH